MSTVKRIMKLSRRLPIHPQWLLGTRKPDPAICKLQGTVLDVGCADRWIERRLAPGTMYIGLDYPPTGSTLYSVKADVLADAASLPFASSSVDAIVCLEVLEHTRDHRAALHEFSRVLKPRSTLVLSMPFMYPIHDAPHDYQRLTEHGLRRDIAAAGFEIVRLKKNGHSLRTAGLLFNLALAGGLYTRRRKIGYFMLPFAAILVLFVNIASLALSWMLPDWNALGFGYEVEAVKPR
ncbi:class I SAM-dependent methyltransferase [Fulvimonas sp. R45]|uniref:class I SAM-dependent methyltransferase n=1 Tax=Fulvimonas sp. R45 TaxID=3045937 RepID=UPI00265E51AE|nr:class I SAM-dependent methyltransferase [Fulvimonas sp. R45]MDO1527785.1 class I SAM-dependent methyltransferase [Fulvimonas sp. R45]